MEISAALCLVFCEGLCVLCEHFRVVMQEGNTALHWATFAGSVPIMEVFIEAGCKMDSPNEHGDRPL